MGKVRRCRRFPPAPARRCARNRLENYLIAHATDPEARMTLRDFIKGELIDIVEWLETNPDMVAWRFVRPDNEIKNGARLIVRPGQLAVCVDEGNVADVFQPGSHELTTKNLPVLSTLRGWKFGFASPFKAEVV